jgi:hypothetical protein
MYSYICIEDDFCLHILYIYVCNSDLLCEIFMEIYPLSTAKTTPSPILHS